MSFLGFPRPDGQVGVRNHIAIISTVICANDVTLKIAQQVEGAVAFFYNFRFSNLLIASSNLFSSTVRAIRTYPSPYSP